jgi:hypothetical protein
MPLSLAVVKGQNILIGDHCLEVKAILAAQGPNEASPILVSMDNGEDILVTENCITEILPDVTVFSGLGKTGNRRRLAFTASKHIIIRRL